MPTNAAPQASRYASLDIVRGVAVMGILAMNIQSFALPEAAYMMPEGPQSQGAVNEASWFVDFVLFNNKMRSLFSILFGASCLLVIERALVGGLSPVKVHYSRMIWLLIFGLVHALLIWWGDILTLYATAGLMLYFARNLSLKSLWVWTIILFAFDFLIFGLSSIFGTLIFTGLIPSDFSPEIVKGLSDTMRFSAQDYSKDLTLFRSGYDAIVADRWSGLADLLVLLFVMIPGTLGLMTLGMALYRNGFLIGEWDLSQYRRVAILSLCFAMPVNIGMGVWAVASGYDPLVGFVINLGVGGQVQIVAAVGYAALILWWWRGYGRDSVVALMLARTGQMAFTNYLGTSIVMTSIFYGYGFGLFGYVERYALWGFVIAAWAAMLSASWYWMRRYRYGPLEWLWRSLARAKPQTMMRSQNASKPLNPSG